MGIEIERKFLVVGDEWKNAPGVAIRQGYLCRSGGCAVRVRITQGRGMLTVKGGAGQGCSGLAPVHAEFEYEIPLDDALSMLELAEGPVIEKTRHTLRHEGFVWEVDVFAGENQGLILAEIELERADQPFSLPPWAGPEVTDDPRYYNANLVAHPYRDWKKQGGGFHRFSLRPG